MAWLFWRRNNPTIDAFANQLANRFFSKVPPVRIEKAMSAAPRKGRGGKPPAVPLERAAGDTSRDFRQFVQEHRLGLYGRARLHTQFRTRLVELGYSDEDASTIDEMILLQGV